MPFQGAALHADALQICDEGTGRCIARTGRRRSSAAPAEASADAAFLVQGGAPGGPQFDGLPSNGTGLSFNGGKLQ